MMKRKAILCIMLVLTLAVSISAAGGDKKPKDGPLTGTWECQSHGGSQGDMPFTLMLQQNGEEVTGSVESPMGGTGITSATFKKKILEIRIETSNGDYLLTATLKNDKLSGDWSHDPEKGTWEGSKQADSSTN